MPFILRPALPTDYPTLTSIYLDAFSTDPISQTCFPRTPSTTTWWETSLRTELLDPNAHFLTIHSPETSTTPSTMIAFAKWNAPQTSPIPPEPLPDFPPDGDTKFAEFFFGSLNKFKEKIMGDRAGKYWYLEILATRKGWQGKGAAGKLIRWGVERADEEGRECYLEASPEGKPIYERFGFGEVERMELFQGEFVEVLMVREGRGKGGGV